MTDLSTLARWMVILGMGLAALGGLIWLAGRVGLPLGQLPGDIRIQREGFSCFVPLASSLLISIFLSLLLNLLLRLLNR